MKKIYVVDDDHDIVEAISIVLKKNGYDVLAQHNPENLSENIKSTRPDLIILDVMFPEDMSAGFSIARDLKGDEATAHIPIMMLSAINERGIYAGKFSEHDINDSFLPVNAFLEKPISPAMLLQKVRELVKD